MIDNRSFGSFTEAYDETCSLRSQEPSLSLLDSRWACTTNDTLELPNQIYGANKKICVYSLFPPSTA